MHTFTFLTHLPTNSSEKASLILPACPEHMLPRSETGAEMSPASIRTEAGQSCEHGTISANSLFQERRGEERREVTTASWGGGQVPRHCPWAPQQGQWQEGAAAAPASPMSPHTPHRAAGISGKDHESGGKKHGWLGQAGRERREPSRVLTRDGVVSSALQPAAGFQTLGGLHMQFKKCKYCPVELITNRWICGREELSAS